MNTFAGRRMGRIAAVLVLAAAGMTAGPREGGAEVERIREKALELAQKLNKQGYEVATRGVVPNSTRVYKDFDFILKKSKVDEVAAETADPEAQRLRFFLVEAIVSFQIATYEDDLLKFEQTGTANVDGRDMTYGEILRDLSISADDAARRKLYSALSTLVETQAVFKGDILKRRNEGFQPWGYQNFADFYVAREGIDLDAVGALADELLQSTQATYDSLFSIMATRHLNTEPRKVKYYDLAYLASGMPFASAFPDGDRAKRVRSVLQGLGVDLTGANGPALDDAFRPDKSPETKVFPILVPGDVKATMNPTGGVRDDAEALFALGLAGIFSYSGQSTFEPAYLPNRAAQAAMAYLPRFVLDEPAWITGAAKGELDRKAFETYRLFSLLYDARLLAAQARFEIDAYRGVADLDGRFRTLMEAACGARLSASDAKRSLSALSQLRSASRFQGFLMAAAMREHLVSIHGGGWYLDGKAGSALKDLWKQGGRLNLDAIGAAFGGAKPATAPLINHIQTSLAAAQ